jgi:hypothetical protein
MTFYKRQKYGVIKKISGCQGLGRRKRRMNRRDRGFLGQ